MRVVNFVTKQEHQLVWMVTRLPAGSDHTHVVVSMRTSGTFKL